MKGSLLWLSWKITFSLWYFSLLLLSISFFLDNWIVALVFLIFIGPFGIYKGRSTSPKDNPIKWRFSYLFGLDGLVKWKRKCDNYNSFRFAVMKYCEQEKNSYLSAWLPNFLEPNSTLRINPIIATIKGKCNFRFYGTFRAYP